MDKSIFTMAELPRILDEAAQNLKDAATTIEQLHSMLRRLLDASYEECLEYSMPFLDLRDEAEQLLSRIHLDA